MQHEFRVYGRAGEPCERCGTPIAKTRVAGRGTWYCPVCQPEAPALTRERGELSGREPLVEPAVAVEPPELGVAADRACRRSRIWGTVQPPVRSNSVRAERRVVVDPDLLVLDAARLEQRLRAHAVAAPARRVHLESLAIPLLNVPDAAPRFHPGAALDCRRGRAHVEDRSGRAALACARRGRSRPPSLHARPGRIGAVAKGVRKTKLALRRAARAASHVELLLHQGRGELQTVTGVELVRSHARAARSRTGWRSGSSAPRRCCASSPSRRRTPRAFDALTRFLDVLDERPGALPARPALDPLALVVPAQAPVALGLPAAPEELRRMRGGAAARRLLAARGRRASARVRRRTRSRSRREGFAGSRAPARARSPTPRTRRSGARAAREALARHRAVLRGPRRLPAAHALRMRIPLAGMVA